MSRFGRVAGWLLCIVAGAGFGWSDDTCPQAHVCDITERGCQRSVFEAVACMRHSEGELPPVSVLSRAQLGERLAQQRQDDPEDDAHYALWTRGLALLELAPPNYGVDQANADELAEIAAVYLGKSKEIVVVSDAVDGSVATTLTPQQLAVTTLAHEFVHALQDQELDLSAYGKRGATSYDAGLALSGIIEGEATQYELLVRLQLEGRRSDQVDWQGFYGRWRARTLLDAEHDAAPVALAGLRFPYAFGGAYVMATWLARGRAGIDQLLDHPPRSTREIMFGPADGSADEAAEALEEQALPILSGNFTPRFFARLGAWITRVYAGHTNMPAGLRLYAPRGLRADVLSMQVDTDADQVAVSWRASFGDQSAAARWPGLFELPPGVVGAPVASTLDAFVIASETALPEDLSTLSWSKAAEPENTESASDGMASKDMAAVDSALAPDIGRLIACRSAGRAW